jgi:trehalose/maltose hydrolase-like predicted phosphorylase
VVAAEIGELERAYNFFLQTATIDLTGKSKQYIGPLYIGGTHPAANGAAWIVAIKGFAGLKTSGETPSLNPRLPKAWKSLRFGMQWRGMRFHLSMGPSEIRIEASPDNQAEMEWTVCGQALHCAPGKPIVHPGLS